MAIENNNNTASPALATPLQTVEEEEQNIVAPVVESQQPAVPLPATEENQEATQEVLEEEAAKQQAFQKKKQEISQNRFRTSAEMEGDLKAQAEDQDIDRSLDAIEAEAQEQDEAEAADIIDQEKQIAQRKAQLARAEKLGIKLDPSPIDDLIQQRELAGTENPDDQNAELLATPTNDEVEKEARRTRSMLAKEEAAEKELAKKQLQTEQETKKAEVSILNQDEEIDKIDTERFWKNQSTWGKIRLSLGAALLSGGGNAQVALNHINNLVDQDIEAQKTTLANKLAKKEHGLRRARLELDKESAKTSNQVKQMQIQKMQSEILSQEQEIRKNRLIQEQLKKGDINPSLLEKDDRERLVVDPSGKKQLAISKEAAGEIRRFTGEALPIIKGAQRILAMSKKGSRFNLVDRAKIATDMKALIGQLRVPLVGPGALTKEEIKILEDTVGDPNKLFALPSIERVKLETVIKKVRGDLKDKYKVAGVDYNATSKRDQLKNTLIKNSKAANKKISMQSVEDQIDRMVQEGKLSEEYAY